MKTYDFTHTGGFPLTQNIAARMQAAYIEAIQAIGKAGGDITGPMILSGMDISSSGNTVTDGWFFYNNELIKFTGGTVAPGGGDVSLVLITVSSTSLPFKDASTPNVVNESTATLIAGPTATDATHFPVSALTQWMSDIIETRVNLGGDTIRFDKNRTIIYSGAYVSGTAFTFDYSNAKVGAIVTIHSTYTGGGAVAITGGGTQLFMDCGVGLTGTDLIMEIKYLGNLIGTNYYSLKKAT